MMLRALFVACLCAAFTIRQSSATVISQEYDCAFAEFAWHEVMALTDRHDANADALNRTVYDALQLGTQCGVPPPSTPAEASWVPPTFPTPPPGAPRVFADAVRGSDATGDGTIAHPVATVHRAVELARTLVAPGATVLLRAGTYYLAPGGTLELTAADSGLTIQNYEGEAAWLSGGVPLDGRWTRVSTDGANRPAWIHPRRTPHGFGCVTLPIMALTW